MTTPTLDDILEANPYPLALEFKLATAYRALLEHARELERELAELKAQ
jgi:hypothetical protein